MSIAGGAIFGLLVGTLVVVVSASIGATLAFLVARFVLRDSVQKRFEIAYHQSMLALKKMVRFTFYATFGASCSILPDQSVDGAYHDSHLNFLLGEFSRYGSGNLSLCERWYSTSRTH